MPLRIFSKRTLTIIALTGFYSSPLVVFSAADLFPRDLHVGVRGEDVRQLQVFLNTDVDTRVSAAGNGSSGNETDYFGPATKRALVKFQEKYRDEVLIPAGLTSGSGFFGSNTRAKVNALIKNSGSASALQNLPPANIPVIASPQNAVQTAYSLPVRLKIPGINVDAAVTYVGLTPDGAMGVPKGPDDVAWYNLGPPPGQIGSAVISGHEGWKNGIPAVFDDLHKLRKGDRVFVEGENGTIIGFVVREVRSYGENADAFEVFNSSDGKAHLNLITCEGVWNKVTKSYPNRLIVFTDKVDSIDSF